MQLSINVIKNSRVIKQGNREINTQLIETSRMGILGDNHNLKIDNMESYENIARSMLDNAGRESEKIISKAYVDAAKIKTQGFVEGLDQGNKEGYETGYNEAIAKAMIEAKALRDAADDLLIQAKAQYNQYLIEKEQHIKALVVSIAESILKKEVKNTEALNEMIFNCLKTERNIKSYIIKINITHFAMVKEQIEKWKNNLAFQGDIFVIEDNFLDDGTAVIEKETGRSIVSIAYGIEKIIEVFQEVEIQM